MTTPAPQVRVVRLCLDNNALTPAQQALLARHAGTARAAWNWGLARSNEHADAVDAHVRAAAAQTAGPGATDDQIAAVRADKTWAAAAYRKARAEIGPAPSAQALGREFTQLAQDPDSRFGWWGSEDHGVNRFAVSTSLRDLDQAFSRYFTDTGGHRTSKRSRPRKDGRPAAWPQFKRKGRDRDAFAIYNLATAGQNPWRVVEDGHRIKVPTLGSLRVHENTRRLRRMLQRGGRPTGVRFTRIADRWYLAITVTFTDVEQVLGATGAPAPTRPDRRQRAAGVVGVDLGVAVLATMSDGRTAANVRHGRTAQRRITRLQHQLQRRQGPRKGVEASQGWQRTKTRLGRAQRRLAEHRRTVLHQLTKTLATDAAVVGIEDLNVVGMTATPLAKPDPDRPGAWLANGRAAKTGLNKAILDVGFGEFRRQLTYKTTWSGSTLVQVARYAPTSKSCSACGTAKTTLTLAERIFRCTHCGLEIDRDLNAAINIAALAAAITSTPSPADAGDEKRQPNGAGGDRGRHHARTARPRPQVGSARHASDLVSVA